MNRPCPYCLVSSRDSDDHVFPDFLGGTRKVQCCTKCNNSFGHRFEGPVSRNLAPFVVSLSFSGYKHKRLVVHERAWIDETTGIEYDLDSERQSYPNKPHLIKEDGTLKHIVARSPREARKIAASLMEKGHLKGFVEKFEIKDRQLPPVQNVQFSVGGQIRQLAVKMCTAIGQLMVPDLILLDEQCRQFLLDESPASSPVQQSYMRYPQLDARRPPLAHAVYIEGDSHSAKCFGVVQLFGGAFQFYVPLSSSYTGRDFAALGVLDVTTFQEQFQEIERLQLPESPRFTSLTEVEHAHSEWGTNFNAQVQAAFGRNELLIGISPKQSVTGVRLTLPLLWVEHEAEIQVAMDLMLDKEPGEDVTLPSDAFQWVLSPDLGRTTLAVRAKLTQNDLPMSRDPSWPTIADPDSYKAAAETILVVERWDIDAKSLRFTDFRAETEATP